jgi:hypothetical protein
MRRRFEPLRALAPWERRMLVRLALLLPVIGATLHLLGFKQTRDLLARLIPAPSYQHRIGATALSSDLVASSPFASDPFASDKAQRIARLVSIAANHGPYRATCLRQSLALWWLLRRRGIAAELRIGVRKDGAALLAHAWVEHEGQALPHVRGAHGSYAAFGPLFPAQTVAQP